jgi:hypothetical protein
MPQNPALRRLFDKQLISWSPKDRPPLRQIYRSLIRLRKDYAAFRNGHVVWLHNSKEDTSLHSSARTGRMNSWW